MAFKFLVDYWPQLTFSPYLLIYMPYFHIFGPYTYILRQRWIHLKKNWMHVSKVGTLSDGQDALGNCWSKLLYWLNGWMSERGGSG